jgi:antitoxin component YwqK of YwqJK toxin-antitoxin module
VNGKEEGEWFNFWYNGVLKNKSSFKHGELNGAWLSFTPDKTLVKKGLYKRGLKNGMWYDYYNNGRLKEITNYKIVTRKNSANSISILGMKTTLSELDGKYQAFSQIDFLQKSKGKYKKGLKNGAWYDYYPGGVVPTIISNYKNGELNGIFQQLGRRGELIYEINYKDGLKDGWFIAFDANGQEKVRKMFQKGVELQKKVSGNDFTP